jgi:ABC-2 type transport system permease protein
LTALSRTLRAMPTLLRVGFASALAYRSEFVVWILATNMPLVMLALWSAVAREAPIGQYGQKEFTAYFLTTLIIRQLTGSWVVWEMNAEIRQGTLSQRLLRPIHPILSHAADNLAALPLRAAIALPVALISLYVVGREAVTHDPVLWTILPFAVAGAWLMSFSAMFLIGALGLFWESSLAVWDLWFGCYVVFSGYLMPLALFPPWLRHALDRSPFPYLLSFPVRVCLGTIGREAAVRALSVEWAYALAFLGGSLFLFRRGLVRYAAYGG